MKSKVNYSYLSIAVTVAVLVLLGVAGGITLRETSGKQIVYGLIAGVAVFSGLYYCPRSVEATAKGVRVNRLLAGAKTFAYGDIEAVELCYPSAGGLRLWGSGGFFGYWGYFHDTMIGNYFGYYGDHSQCILLRLKSGRQYVIGCHLCADMVKYIASEMKK